MTESHYTESLETEVNNYLTDLTREELVSVLEGFAMINVEVSRELAKKLPFPENPKKVLPLIEKAATNAIVDANKIMRVLNGANPNYCATGVIEVEVTIVEESPEYIVGFHIEYSKLDTYFDSNPYHFEIEFRTDYLSLENAVRYVVLELLRSDPELNGAWIEEVTSKAIKCLRWETVFN